MVKNQHLNYVHKLAETIIDSQDYADVRDKLRLVMEYSNILNFELRYREKLWRVRKLEGEQPFNHTSDIWYPSSELSKVGRLNDIGSPYLYLSLTLETALQETKAQVGDCFQVGMYKFDLDKKARLAVVGEKSRALKGIGSSICPTISGLMKKQYSANKHLAQSSRYADFFFDDIMRDQEARGKGYLQSRMLAQLILEKHRDIDGFLYHSVESEGGQNIALPATKADKLVRFVGTFVIRINEVFPYGIYDFEVIKTSDSVDDKGYLSWSGTL
ncbi:RES family NAD+ phosphorylase [Vibrio splendidus]|uniref:RES family NAD+ phosphorylase n=1 Tax=Vibrio splendidus TaxID=29497 RepID=UPI003D0F65B8